MCCCLANSRTRILLRHVLLSRANKKTHPLPLKKQQKQLLFLVVGNWEQQARPSNLILQNHELPFFPLLQKQKFSTIKQTTYLILRGLKLIRLVGI